jgi:hypothetical protein
MSQHPAAESSETLTDRMQARVKKARVVINRRADASQPDSKQPLDGSPQISTDELREIQSLKRVFREMGVSYRRYRMQTGNRATPGLRDAAYNFRAEPNLTSLVAVAVFLDKLELLS